MGASDFNFNPGLKPPQGGFTLAGTHMGWALFLFGIAVTFGWAFKLIDHFGTELDLITIMTNLNLGDLLLYRFVVASGIGFIVLGAAMALFHL